MIVCLLVIVLLLLLYIGRIVEQTRSQVEAASAFLTTRPESRRGDQRIGLDYEWGQDGWPQWSADAPEDRTRVAYKNPRPYLSQDQYAVALLGAQAALSADAAEMKRFLGKAYQSLGAYLPDVVCDAIVSHPDVLVRVWGASHIALDRTNNSGPSTRDCRSSLKSDRDPLVGAAILSNPANGLFGWLGTLPASRLNGLSQLERLSLMRNPDLNAAFVLALMKERPSETVISDSEYVEAVGVAVLNPNLIERSRRQGRGWYSVWGDPSSPMEEFAEIWELAATTWLTSNPVPYRVFSFIQTQAAIKLDIYRRLSGAENEVFRKAILSGCEPGEDRELLKLGLEDSRQSIVGVATERCGDYLSHVRNFKTKKGPMASKAARSK